MVHQKGSHQGSQNRMKIHQYEPNEDEQKWLYLGMDIPKYSEINFGH